MPHIFPRRFLRSRDVLSPDEVNQDFQPAYDLLAGRLDATNFKANLSRDLRVHPHKPKTGESEAIGPSVAEGAYFKTHVSQIESRWLLCHREESFEQTLPPNFVKLDGVTFRRNFSAAVESYNGTNPLAYPSIIPNTGVWSSLKNEDLTGAQQITFKSGRGKLWISAYAQYIRQGFYEWKSPWLTGARRHGDAAFATYPQLRQTWASANVEDRTLCVEEAKVLNSFSASDKWEHLPTSTTANKSKNIVISDASFAYPLNEYFSPQDDRRYPDQQGYHHISKGHEPALVQFALRVDGKIIEETITGKRHPYEKSVHGLQVTDSLRMKEEGEFFEMFGSSTIAKKSEDMDDAEFDTIIVEGIEYEYGSAHYIFGQRSIGTKTVFGDLQDSRPGQHLMSSRATTCGPEVLPVRLGAVVDLEPGNHTIEIVARRLNRDRFKFEAGDFVGVFSRRILAFELPTKDTRIDPVSPGGSANLGEVANFLTEDTLSEDNLTGSIESLAATANKIKSTHIDDNVLANRHLPSKVIYSRSKEIEPERVLNEYTGFEGSNQYSASGAIFPGFASPDYIDNAMPGTDINEGYRSIAHYMGVDVPAESYSNETTGWNMLRAQLTRPGSSPDNLSITLPQTTLEPYEKLILMMDVELRGFNPIYSADVEEILTSATTKGVSYGGDVREMWSRYGNFILAERYLDLFASFAIGVKHGGAVSDYWEIGSGAVPSLVNSYNWVNRGPLFHSGHRGDFPMNIKEFQNNSIWDADPGWHAVMLSPHKRSKSNFFNVPTVSGVYSSFLNEPTGDILANPSHNRIHGRGGKLTPSNYGINIPIMQVIENTGSTAMTINEVAGFVSSSVPWHWRSGYSQNNHRSMPSFADETPAPPLPAHRIPKTWPYAWVSPTGGRNMLLGVEIHYGNSRLSAIKITK